MNSPADAPPSAHAESPAPDGPPHLQFITGLRGATALYVVLYHCYFIEITSGYFDKNFSALQRVSMGWLGYGEEAMAVFLVISGFCLSFEALKRTGPGANLLGFMWRRSRRLLPPYFIILALLLPLIAAFPLMDRINLDLFEGTQAPNLSRGNLLSHALLFDNLKYAWKFGIDPPAWGVATIWWMYVLFALVLWPAWRRIGSGPLILLTVAAGLLPHFWFHAGDPASPWFIGIFALGMGAAARCLKPTTIPPFRRLGWMTAALAALVLLARIALFNEGVTSSFATAGDLALDLAVGCATAALIVACYFSSRAGRRIVPLESRPLVKLGRFSYSIFLVHYPLLWALHVWVVAPLSADPLRRFYTLLALGVPAALLASWLFSRVFERPFKNAE